MSILEKFKSKYLSSLSLEDQLKALYEKLAEEQEVRSLKDHPGWKRVVGVLRATAVTLQEEIIRLCSSPTENAEKLIYLKSNRDAVYALIGIVEKSDRDVKTFIEKINKIEEKVVEAADLGQFDQMRRT